MGEIFFRADVIRAFVLTGWGDSASLRERLSNRVGSGEFSEVKD